MSEAYIVREAPREHYGWLVERVGYAPTSGLCALEAVNSSGEIVAMFGFDNWMHNSAEVHFAVQRPAKLHELTDLIYAAFNLVFNRAKREYLIALTPASRAKALQCGRRWGARELYRLKDGCAPGDDLVFSAMHKSDCIPLRRRET